MSDSISRTGSVEAAGQNWSTYASRPLSRLADLALRQSGDAFDSPSCPTTGRSSIRLVETSSGLCPIDAPAVNAASTASTSDFYVGWCRYGIPTDHK